MGKQIIQAELCACYNTWKDVARQGWQIQRRVEAQAVNTASLTTADWHATLHCKFYAQMNTVLITLDDIVRMAITARNVKVLSGCIA